MQARDKQIQRLTREERLGSLKLSLANGKRIRVAQLRSFSRVVSSCVMLHCHMICQDVGNNGTMLCEALCHSSPFPRCDTGLDMDTDKWMTSHGSMLVCLKHNVRHKLV